MNTEILKIIHQLNPWLSNPSFPILDIDGFIPRKNTQLLLQEDWNRLWTILTGPRQSGKTTLGKFMCRELVTNKKFNTLLYLNCDLLEIREWLKSANFIQDAIENLNIKNFVLFIDEIQRIENPGLLLKSVGDMSLPIKMIASGSSQLEIKSKVQEFLTGRHIEAIIMPLCCSEIGSNMSFEEHLIYGAYPQIVKSKQKKLLLRQLYSDYVSKDIIEILKVGKPDVMQKLIGLIAHSSGQLVNYNQLATDCGISTPTVQNYLSILERTYVLHQLKPFVGNKRTEITSNPIYYFIDNGFRNQALKNFSDIGNRTDSGLLIQSFVFQEILKLKTYDFMDFDIFYWRTTAGAEVDFVVRKAGGNVIPIEAKYRNLKKPTISKGFRSFVEAYEPPVGIILTRSFIDKRIIGNTEINFIPIENMDNCLRIIAEK